MQFSTSIGKLTQNDHDNILMIWQQLQRLEEEMEDELRKLKKENEDINNTVTKNARETDEQITALDVRVTALENA